MGAAWPRLEAAALEAGGLDAIDQALISGLAARLPDAIGPDRADAFRAVVACLIAAVRSGGLRIPILPETLAARLETWLGALPSEPDATDAGRAETEPPDALADRMAADFHAARLEGAFAAVMGSPGAYLPLIAHGSSLYFQKHHAAEALAGTRLRAILEAPDPAAAPGSHSNVLVTVLDKIPLRTGSAPGAPAMEFDAGQKAALALALRKRFTVISGGPGTGKTSLAANFLRAWTRLREGAEGPPRIRLAAPTGRAAQRLSESIRRSLASLGPDGAVGPDAFVRDLACGTLHALLRYHPGTGGFFHGAARPLPADLVLVDEVSMVDIFLLARLVDSLEPHACLVLLGDMDQLPSVEAGSILADLAPAGSPADHPLKDHLAVLTRSHRSDAGILEAARRINALDGAGALAALPPPMRPESAAWPLAFLEAGRAVVPGGGCRMLLPPAAAPAGDAGWRSGRDAWLESWVDFHYLGHAQDPAKFPGRLLAEPRTASYETLIQRLCGIPETGDGRDALLSEAFAYLDQARILTFTRKGWHGASSINRAIGEMLMKRWDPRGRDPAAGFPGAPVMILENDPARGLFNGDVGLRLRMEGRDLAWFRRGEGFEAHPAAFLPRNETAFAMTVHKSQGSEYDQVLLVLPEAGNRLLFKETLYTALTRARRYAAIYGPPEVFLEASGRRIERESGLAGYLAAPAP